MCSSVAARRLYLLFVSVPPDPFGEDGKPRPLSDGASRGWDGGSQPAAKSHPSLRWRESFPSIKASPGRGTEGTGPRTCKGTPLALPGATLGDQNLFQGGWGRLGPLLGTWAALARDAMAPAPVPQGEGAWLVAPKGTFRAASSTSSFVQDGLNRAAHGCANQAELGMGPGQKSADLNLNHNPNFPEGSV